MNTSKMLIATIVGLLCGMLIMWLGNEHQSENIEDKKVEPLYWVAPMDPNFRRDKPGKSPMGMDLVPVYAEDKSQTPSETSSGLVTISPELVNNMGVRTTSVAIKGVQEEIKAVGYVQYDQDQIVHVHPRVEGWIEKLYVKATGEPVKKDQRLYDLYSPPLVNAQEELLLALNRNNTPLIDGTIERLRALQISDQFIDDFKKNKKVQQSVPFYAPQSGVVDNLNVREGFYVGPGTTLMSISVLDDVWVEAQVFERQMARLGAGMAVTMRLDYFPEKEWKGEVDYIYPTLDPMTRTARVRVRFENKNAELKPGMFAQLVIHTEVKKALVIPREALIRTGDQNRVVLALGEGRFESVAVKTGQMYTDDVEVLEGLQQGDEVVISAQFLLDSESNQKSELNRIQGLNQGGLNQHEGIHHD